MKQGCLAGLFLLFHLVIHAQSYKLQIAPAGLQPSPYFYFSSIVDEREQKDHAGRALIGNKKVVVDFRKTLSEDISLLLSPLMIADSLKVPLIFSVDRFVVNETGSLSRHVASLDFAYKIKRIINGNSYVIYEGNGNPSITIHGTYDKAHETIITKSMQQFIEGFNQWIQENKDLYQLARKVELSYKEEDRYSHGGDTIAWSATKRLQWSDFKGRPSGSSFMAQSNCLFSYSVDPKMKEGICYLNIRLSACFEKTNSWVKKGNDKDALLAHEQLHFDICEVNVRALRKRLSETKLNPIEFDLQISRLFDEAWKKYQEDQDAYDNETDHG